jgi:hypothetical protein
LKLALCSFEILHGIDWWFLTDDILGQAISASFEGQADQVFTDSLTLEDGTYVLPTLATHYQSMLCKAPKEQGSHFHCGRSLKSCRFKVAL